MGNDKNTVIGKGCRNSGRSDAERKSPLLTEDFLTEDFTEILPYYKCSDQQIIDNHSGQKEEFLKSLEANNLSKDIIEHTSTLLENFHCSYENESSFQKLTKKHNSNSLKIFHLNIRSINKHKLLLKHYIESLNCNFDLIFLSETGNAKTEEIEEIFINYIFFIDPPKQGRGSKGGSGILVNRNSFKSIEEIFEDDCLKNKCDCTNCIIENKWLKLKTTKNSYTIGSIYRHPGGNSTHFTKSLDTLLKKTDNKSTLILAGDVNINLLKQENKDVDIYLETLMEHNILPYICIPTRITDSSATIIDHINVRVPSKQIHTKISSGNLICDISDHLPNYFIMDSDINKSKDRPLIRIYSRKNIKRFKQNINNEPPLLPHPRSNDPNTLLTELTYNLNKLLNEYFPLTKISRKKYNEKFVMTKQIKSMIKKRNNLHNIYLRDRNDANKENWRIMRNQTTQAIRNLEIENYKNQIKEHGNNCQAMWKTLSHIIGNKKKKNTGINSLIINEKQVTNQDEITDGLNEFFCYAGENLDKQLEDTNENEFFRYLKAPVRQSIDMSKILTKEVLLQINKLELKKSAGHDGLNAKFLKLSIPLILIPLTYIFNVSMNTGIYPDELKIAKCIPIYKKGKKDDPSNYRPISVLSSINKIYEKLIHQRLYKHLIKYNVLYEYQYGFRENHSTTQALIEITDYLKSSIDEKKYVCGMFLDLSKAFDTVNHNILLKKLQHYGVRGTANTLLKNYLTNRLQYVSLGNTHSSKRSINCGVPQGSVLGPLLFLIYINDLAQCSSTGKIRIFADDTSAFIEGRIMKEIIANSENLMNSLNKWFIANRLTLSAGKSCFVVFKSPRSKPDFIPKALHFGKNTINKAKSVKYLGVTLEEHLGWSEHVQNVCNSLKKCFGIFYSIRDYISTKQIKTIYYSLVYSKITYALAVYGLTTKENLLQIQRLQNKLLKVLTKKHHMYSTNDLHNDLNILKVEDLVDQEILTFVSNFRNNKLPHKFNDKFKFRSNNQQTRTRNIENHLITPLTRTEYGEQTVSVKGPVLWNKLPNHLSTLTNTKAFRTKWKKSQLPYTDA